MNELIEEIVQVVQAQPSKMKILSCDDKWTISVSRSYLIVENDLEVEYIISLN